MAALELVAIWSIRRKGVPMIKRIILEDIEDANRRGHAERPLQLKLVPNFVDTIQTPPTRPSQGDGLMSCLGCGGWCPLLVFGQQRLNIGQACPPHGAASIGCAAPPVRPTARKWSGRYGCRRLRAGRRQVDQIAIAQFETVFRGIEGKRCSIKNSRTSVGVSANRCR